MTTGRTRERVRVSTVAHRIVVRCPIGVFAAMLTDEPGRWMLPFLRIACHDGDAEAGRARAREGLPSVQRAAQRRTVALTVDEPSFDADDPSVSVAIHWVALGYGSLPPVFDGQLTLRPVPSDQTEVSIHGTFKPAPIGQTDPAAKMAIRSAMDRALDSLLTNLGAALMASSTQEPGPR